jgi:hypothetical protein
VKAAGGNAQAVFAGFVHQPVFLIDAPRPIATQVAFQRFGLTRASERGSLAFFQQRVDFAENGPVGFLPVEVLLPKLSRPR